MMPGYTTSALRTIIGATFIWASSSTSTIAAPTAELSPFTATYEFDWDGSISLSGKTTRKLSKGKEQQWLFESKASALFASIYESSRFQWQAEQIQPQKYTYKRSAFGKKKQVEVEFDWPAMQVTNLVKDKPWQMKIDDGVQDKISYQLLLQQEVAAGKTEFIYQVADGGHLKEYRFVAEGTEQIEAPIGTFEAIRVKRVRDAGNERQTYIWFAPELNYQIIKLHQIEKKDKEYSLLLKSIE